MSSSNHDPVCGRHLEPGAEATRVTYAGSSYPFCSTACARTFTRDPERFVSSIDGRKPTGRVPLAEAERQHRAPDSLPEDTPGA